MPNEVQGRMDEVFDKMAKGMTRQQRIKANDKAMDLFEERFKENFLRSMNNHGESILRALTREKTTGGTVAIGFSKQGKKAYLARFHNDGWVPRNQYGGPYPVHGSQPMVYGKHFWENTEEEAKHGDLGKRMSEREIEYWKKIMDDKARGGGN